MQVLTKKFTIDKYEKMIDCGILTEQDKVELIKGEIIEMSPIGLKHIATVIRLTNILPSLFGEKTLISVQNSIQLNDDSQPEPDVVCLKNRSDFYETKRPTPEDILLLIEVSDSSLKYDQEIKLPLYAESGVNEVWLVNLNNDTLEVYKKPHNKTYQQEEILSKKDQVSCLAFPQLIINVSDFFN